MTDCWKLSLKWIFKFITLNISSVNDDIGLNLFKKRIFWKSNRQRFKDKDIYCKSYRGEAQLMILQPRTLRYLQFIQNCDLINTRSHVCFWVCFLCFSNGAFCQNGTILADNLGFHRVFAYFCHDNHLPLIYCVILCNFFLHINKICTVKCFFLFWRSKEFIISLF